MKHCYIILVLFLCTLDIYGQDGYIKGVPSLAYWKKGKANITVIILHGGPGAPHQYLQPEFDTLSEVAKIIYYDQRGCGKSDKSTSYTWQEHVADLKRLKNALVKNEKVILAGSSWGSQLALLYAYTYPQDIKGLILSGTFQWAGQAKPYIKRIDYPHYPPHKQQMYEHRIITSSTQDGKEKQDTVIISKTVELYSVAPLTESWESLISAPIADCLKKIALPVLLINGSLNRDRDWVNNYKVLFPNVDVYTINGAGHDPWFSEPSLFFSRCKKFISSLVY